MFRRSELVAVDSRMLIGLIPRRRRHSVSVAAVIVDAHGRVLIIQRRDNARWEPPGGVLELKETVEQGLCREVREETGYDVEIEAQTGVYKNMERGVIALVFRCRIVGGQPRYTTTETLDLRWLEPHKAISYLDATYAVRVTDALAACSGPPAIRAHDGQALLAAR